MLPCKDIWAAVAAGDCSAVNNWCYKVIASSTGTFTNSESPFRAGVSPNLLLYPHLLKKSLTFEEWMDG